jgi:hypothetical protein
MRGKDRETVWQDVQTDGDPHLILGRRQGKREIEAVLVELHEDLFAEVRGICEQALAKLTNTKPRTYEPNAEVDRDAHHFVLRLDALPDQPAPPRSRSAGKDAPDADDNPDRTAALVKTLRNPGSLQPVDATRLSDFTAIFYSLAYQQDDDTWAHFITKVNPRRVLKRGRIWTQFGDMLRRSEAPALVLEPNVDVILTSTILAGFGATAIKNLFTDVHLVMRDVPVYVENIAEALGGTMPFSTAAKEALLAHVGRKVSVAARLYRLQERIPSLDLKPDRVREILIGHGIDPDRLVGRDGDFSFDETGASDFLDVVEGRFFEDDFTGEPRRADRFSTRP